MSLSLSGPKRALLLASLLTFPGLWPLSAQAADGDAPAVGDNVLASSGKAPKITELEKLHIEAEKRIAVNDFRGALEKYRDAVLLEADDAAAYSNMGHCYLILGDTGRARESFRSALAIDPQNASAHAGMMRVQDPDAQSVPEEA